MGLYATAKLIFGVPIRAYDEDGEPTMWWDEDDGDWNQNCEGEHWTLRTFGHCDSDETQAILSPKGVESFSGDCWDPTLVPINALNGFWLGVFEAQRAFEAAVPEADVKLTDSKWWLVASYG